MIVDETTPLAKRAASLVGEPGPDAVIELRLQSGALEDTRHLTSFGPRRARVSVGLALLRARDRLRPDFADVPSDLELTNSQNSAWDAYCAGRLERAGIDGASQRYRYDVRNRFGVRVEVDATFDRMRAADDLAWSDLPGTG